MENLKLYYFVLFICLLFTRNGLSQSNEKTDFQTWTDLTLTHFINEKWSVGGDLGPRGIVSSKDWNSFYIRPTVHYQLSYIFNFAGGLNFVYTDNKSVSNVFETRFFQDINIKWPDFTSWIFHHRIRFEQRFFFYDEIDNDFNARGRYLIGVETPDFQLLSQTRNFYVIGQFEVFVPMGESAVELFVNNNRIIFGFGHRLSGKFRYELNYIRQNSRELADDGFKTAENILRIRFNYHLNQLE